MNEKTDFYTELAALALAKPADQVTPEEREAAKRLNLTTLYGSQVDEHRSAAMRLNFERMYGGSAFKALGKDVRGPSKELETFPAPANLQRVAFESKELESQCPVTGQPDIYTVTISFRPNLLCLESKSLKRYLWSFREERHFAEELASIIAQCLFRVLQPKWIVVRLVQNVRGGLKLTTEAEIHEESCYYPQEVGEGEVQITAGPSEFKWIQDSLPGLGGEQ